MTSETSLPEVSLAGVRTGRLDKRCHRITFGLDFREWFHCYAPTAADVARIDSNDNKTVHLFVDKLLLISESSFADEGYQRAEDMPFDLFNAILAAIVESGKSATADGKCHLEEAS